MKLPFHLLVLLSFAETSGIDGDTQTPLLRNFEFTQYAVQPFNYEPIAGDTLYFPPTGMDCPEVSHEAVVNAILNYKRYNILNENEKVKRKVEYNRATSLVNCLISSKLSDLKSVTYAELIGAAESVVSGFKDEGLDHHAAQMAVQHSNFAQMWHLFSVDFKQEYLKDILFGLCRGANIEAVAYILHSINNEIQGSLSLELIKPSCESNDKNMVFLILGHVPENMKEEFVKLVIENALITDAVSILDFWIREGVNMDSLMGLLKMAVRFGSTKSIDYLIELMGKEVFARPEHYALLLETLENKNYGIMMYLSSFFQINYSKNMLLRKACARGLKDAVEILLSQDEFGTRKFPTIDPTDAQNDPVIKAGTNGHLDIVLMLLEQNEFRAKNRLPLVKLHARQNSLIIGAAIKHRFKLVNYLLENKQAGKGEFSKIDIADANFRIMQHAFRSGDLRLLKFLVVLDERLKNLNIPTHIDNSEPDVLVQAVIKNHGHILKYILVKYPDLDCGRNKNQLLHNAILYRRKSVIK